MSRKIFIPSEIASDLERFHEMFGISALGDDGREYPSNKKMFVVGEEGAPSLKDRIQRLLRSEISKIIDQQGGETFEEANNFDVMDDEDFRSPYEVQDMVEDFIYPPVEKTPVNRGTTMRAEPETEEPVSMMHYEGIDYIRQKDGSFVPKTKKDIAEEE